MPFCISISLLSVTVLVLSAVSATPKSYSFHKAESGTDDTLNFLVLADWGGDENSPYTTPDEVYVAKQMGIIGSTINAQFVLALGDNFYSHGVQNADDPRFQETFENVFTADSLQVPWYVVAGNHDWYGNVSGEIAYSKKSERWNFPKNFYRLNFAIPGTNDSIVFLMLDTVILAGNSYDQLDIQPSGPEDLSAAKIQWAWIESELKATAKEKYVILTGHYPVWSIAEHGPTNVLVGLLRPLLEKYKVSAYLCGHDHNLQHIREQNSTVEYFIIGAAHVVDTSQAHKDKIPRDSLQYYYADVKGMGGFAYFEAGVDGIRVTFADGIAGKDLYTAHIKPRF